LFAGALYGDWLAGLKFTYKYANIDSKQNVSIPQNGTGTFLSGPLTGSTSPLTGFVQISPAEINLKHQLSAARRRLAECMPSAAAGSWM
jgi:hypothetical protein